MRDGDAGIKKRKIDIGCRKREEDVRFTRNQKDRFERTFVNTCKGVKGLKAAEILCEGGERREVNWMREIKELRERKEEEREEDGEE